MLQVLPPEHGVDGPAGAGERGLELGVGARLGLALLLLRRLRRAHAPKRQGIQNTTLITYTTFTIIS